MEFKALKSKIFEFFTKVVTFVITVFVVIFIIILRVITVALFLFYAASIISLSILFVGTRNTSGLLVQLGDTFKKHKI